MDHINSSSASIASTAPPATFSGLSTVIPHSDLHPRGSPSFASTLLSLSPSTTLLTTSLPTTGACFPDHSASPLLPNSPNIIPVLTYHFSRLSIYPASSTLLLSLPKSSCPSPSVSLPPPSSGSSLSLHPMVTRTRDNICTTKKIPDFVWLSNVVPSKSTSLEETELITYSMASKSVHKRNAMSVEYNALIQNNTWPLVSPPQTANIIGCKWIFWIKRKADGSIEQYKK